MNRLEQLRLLTKYTPTSRLEALRSASPHNTLLESLQMAQKQANNNAMTHYPMEGIGSKGSAAINYLNDVFSGTIAKNGLLELQQVAENARQNPQGLLDYFGPGGLAAKGAGLLGMTAYHGSPHKFDKFSLNHIGKGEGNQAYGHGLYFAEDPKIAGHYAEMLDNTRFADDLGFEKHELDRFTDPKSKARSMVLNQLEQQRNYEGFEGYDLNEALEYARETFRDSLEKIKNYPEPDDFAIKLKNDDLSATREALAELDEIDLKKFTIEGGKNFYTVDIPDNAIENFLDWDKPLSEQPENIKPLIEKLLKEKGTGSAKGVTKGKLKAFIEGRDVGAEPTGQDLYRALSDYGEKSIEGSNTLNKLGIKGIKYLDGTSRNAGEGTRNFVVFDEDLIKILNRE